MSKKKDLKLEADKAAKSAEEAIEALGSIPSGRAALKAYAEVHRNARNLDLTYRPFLTQLEKASATHLVNGTITDMLDAKIKSASRGF